MGKSAKAQKTEAPLRQVAALPMRTTDGRLEVCLVTTRETGRWTLPKGWPMKNRKDFNAARIEAEEEAGLRGTPEKTAIGVFHYWKRQETRFDLIEVSVYPLAVTGTLATFKEIKERTVRWMAPLEAAALVDEPDLATLLRTLV